MHSDVFSTEEWQISAIAAGQHIMLPERNFQIAHEYLLNLSDEIRLSFRFTLLLPENLHH